MNIAVFLSKFHWTYDELIYWRVCAPLFPYKWKQKVENMHELRYVLSVCTLVWDFHFCIDYWSKNYDFT